MYQAQTQLLYQSTNDMLTQIRQSEIGYYQNFLSVFSLLSSLCASLMINTITQIQAYSYTGLAPGLKTWFWMSCVITICVGVHCTVVSSITLVYGIGLALKGPLGSMIRAVKGMDKASKTVLTTYLLTMFMYGKKAHALPIYH